MTDVQHAALITAIPPWLFGFSGTAVKAYLAIRSHERKVGNGAFPSVARVAKMIGVGERAAWNAIRELREAGAIVVTKRGNAKSNRYFFPITLHENTYPAADGIYARNDGVTMHEGAHEVGTGVSIRELPSTEVGLEARNKDWTGPTYGGGTARGGTSQPDAGEILAKSTDLDQQDRLAPADAKLGMAEDVDDGAGRGNTGCPRMAQRGPFASGPTNSAPAFNSSKDFYKNPLPDPDLEQLAVQIVELLDKLRVQTFGVAPLTTGSQPGQLTSARYLLHFDQRPGDEVLDVIRWIFSGKRGTILRAKKITKVYALRQNYPGLLEAYRKAQVTDINSSAFEDDHDDYDKWKGMTPDEQACLRKRLENHR